MDEGLTLEILGIAFLNKEQMYTRLNQPGNGKHNVD